MDYESEKLQFKAHIVLKKEYEERVKTLFPNTVYTYTDMEWREDGFKYILIEQKDTWYPLELFEHINITSN